MTQRWLSLPLKNLGPVTRLWNSWQTRKANDPLRSIRETERQSQPFVPTRISSHIFRLSITLQRLLEYLEHIKVNLRLEQLIQYSDKLCPLVDKWQSEVTLKPDWESQRSIPSVLSLRYWLSVKISTFQTHCSSFSRSRDFGLIWLILPWVNILH